MREGRAGGAESESAGEDVAAVLCGAVAVAVLFRVGLEGARLSTKHGEASTAGRASAFMARALN